uniref:GRF-type domain-containing protein n=1 Tax=Brassica oleracea TaxID=3712 RepID=A0A3P6EBS1_BRAOL|nr:unnamed protein product [Brassica oleracea]
MGVLSGTCRGEKGPRRLGQNTTFFNTPELFLSRSSLDDDLFGDRVRRTSLSNHGDFSRNLSIYLPNLSPISVQLRYHRILPAHHEKRDGEHCKQRWHKLNGDTNKYCAAYAAAERLQSSGQNDNDLVKKAHEIYFADHGSKFTLDHAWCLLRYKQKWLSLNTPKSGGEKRKTGEVGSQASSSNVGEEEPRPEGIKATKARRNSRKGMAVEDFKSVHELKMEDLAKKERLSKLAILDTLLAKKEPTEREENAMGLDYSYTQPSESEDYGLGAGPSSDQAARHQYPPQPEVEFGFPKECYCGGEPLVATSYTRTDPRRMFYTCKNKQDGDCHVYKWWDVAATEEIKAIGAQVTLLTDKLDSLSFVGYEETELRELKEVQFDMEQKLVRLKSIVCDLGRKKSRFGNGFELVLGVLVVVLVIIAIGVAARMIMYLLSHLQNDDDEIDLDTPYEEFYNNCPLVQEPEDRQRRNVHERHREEGHTLLWNDYFADNPTYSPALFRRRFRMNKSLFLRIVNRFSTEIPYFRLSEDCTGRTSLTPLQKCTAAIRQLAYGAAADSVDEYIRVGESTARKCLHKFTARIITLFGEEYLRRPTQEDLERLLHIGEQRGFPGMLGSIDCTMNDLNILDRSPVFDDIFNGIAPQVNFYVNDNQYHF